MAAVGLRQLAEKCKDSIKWIDIGKNAPLFGVNEKHGHSVDTIKG
jgi:hypothetical protein